MSLCCLFYIVGPPLVIDTHTQNEPFFIFSVQFVSIPSTYFLKWCSADKVLNISSKYNQTSTEDVITVHMYGVPVAVAGNTATLTVQSKKDVGANDHISLILSNMLGQASCSFKLRKGI